MARGRYSDAAGDATVAAWMPRKAKARHYGFGDCVEFNQPIRGTQRNSDGTERYGQVARETEQAIVVSDEAPMRVRADGGVYIMVVTEEGRFAYAKAWALQRASTTRPCRVDIGRVIAGVTEERAWWIKERTAWLAGAQVPYRAEPKPPSVYLDELDHRIAQLTEILVKLDVLHERQGPPQPEPEKPIPSVTYFCAPCARHFRSRSAFVTHNRARHPR